MSWSIISHLTTCILVQEIAFEIGYFLHIYIGSYGIPAYRHVSLIDLYLQTKFRSNQKNFFADS